MSEHTQITQLLPWYVNGTLDQSAREKVDVHLATCALCQDELLRERRLHHLIANDQVVEHIPANSLRRFQAVFDQSTSGSGAAHAPSIRRRGHGSYPWRVILAASFAGGILALGLLTNRGLRPDYHTVTSAEPRAHDEVIRAVFAPTITLVELQALLDEAELRIISGPTEAGVYSLASNSKRPPSRSLALLRQHGTVRFAEITTLDPAPSPSEAP